jgi:hypothetical protein
MSSNPCKRFYFKPYLRVLSLCTLLILFVTVVIFSLIVIAFIFLLSTSVKDVPLLGIPILIFIIMVAMLFVSMIFIIFFYTLPILISHLDVTEQGLEYQYWPTYHIRCKWNDLAIITKRREIIMADIIILNRAEELGLPITMTMRRFLGLGTQYFIPLNILDGWPKGELNNILQHYVPHLVV